MPTVRATPATLSLDGRQVPLLDWTLIAPEVEYLRSYSAVLPDPNWVATDQHGHEHRWALTGRDVMSDLAALPTLVRSREHVDCDGSCREGGCEGYNVPVWHCATCGDQVEPRTIPDHQARNEGVPVEVGPATVQLVVGDEAIFDGGGPFAALLDLGDGAPIRGQAWVDEQTISGGPDGVDVRTTLHLLRHA